MRSQMPEVGVSHSGCSAARIWDDVNFQGDVIAVPVLTLQISQHRRILPGSLTPAHTQLKVCHADGTLSIVRWLWSQCCDRQHA